jgi:hypothetical protein
MLVTTADITTGNTATSAAHAVTRSGIATAHIILYILPFFSCSGSSTPNGGRFVFAGGRFIPDGGRFNPNGGRFIPARGRFMPDGGRFVSNGGRFTVNPPAYNPYPTKGALYVNK